MSSVVVRKPSSAVVRRQLERATSLLDGRPAAKDVRAAHTLAAKATAALEQLVQWHALRDAEGHRQHAIKTARVTRDARGYRRGPVTMPGYHLGRPSAVKGQTFRKTPPSTNEVLRMYALAPTARKTIAGACETCGAPAQQPHHQRCINPFGERDRALLLLLWRCGLRIACEALSLHEHHLVRDGGYVIVEKGKNGKPRQVALDAWVWPLLEPWLAFRAELPPGPLFCIVDGPTKGKRAWTASSVRRVLHRLAAVAGVRERMAPHQLRHAMALSQRAEGIDLVVISRNMGHANVGVTDTYFQGMPPEEVHRVLHGRPVPQISMIDYLRNEGMVFDRLGVPCGLDVVGEQPRVEVPDLMGALRQVQATASRRAAVAAVSAREAIES